jgi:hypothetical protein
MALPGRLAGALPALVCALLPLAIACGSESAPPSASKGGGGNAGAGGGGVDTCEPGHSTADDGTCIPAGVPPTLCGEGFEADDAGLERDAGAAADAAVATVAGALTRNEGGLPGHGCYPDLEG